MFKSTSFEWRHHTIMLNGVTPLSILHNWQGKCDWWRCDPFRAPSEWIFFGLFLNCQREEQQTVISFCSVVPPSAHVRFVDEEKIYIRTQCWFPLSFASFFLNGTFGRFFPYYPPPLLSSKRLFWTLAGFLEASSAVLISQNIKVSVSPRRALHTPLLMSSLSMRIFFFPTFPFRVWRRWMTAVSSL